MRIAITPAPLLAGVAVLVGSAAAILLSLFSRPPDTDPRMAQVRTTMAQVQRLNAQPGSTGVLPLGAVCRGPSARSVQDHKARISQSARRRGLSAAALQVSLNQGAAEGQLTSLRVEWKGRGDYGALVGLLSDLAMQKPTLFVDALDIKPRGIQSEFELKGKIWCWTPVDSRS